MVRFPSIVKSMSYIKVEPPLLSLENSIPNIPTAILDMSIQNVANARDINVTVDHLVVHSLLFLVPLGKLFELFRNLIFFFTIIVVPPIASFNALCLESSSILYDCGGREEWCAEP